MEHKDELNHYKQSIDIRDYLKNAGYETDKSRDTRRFQAFTHKQSGDKVYVPISNKYATPNYYVNQFDNKDKGTVVDFVMTRERKNLEEARLTLREFDQSYTPSKSHTRTSQEIQNGEDKQKRQQYIIQKIVEEHPSGANEPYLEKRLLDYETRNHAAFQDKVKLNEAPDERFVAFPMQDENGKVTGLAMKSNTTERFLGNRTGVWMSNPTLNKAEVDRVVITEHPIDAMSYHQLRQDKEKNVIHLSTAGNPSPEQVAILNKQIKTLQPKEVVLANDNDAAGRKYDQTYTEALKDSRIPVVIEKSEFKDWNADVYAKAMYTSRMLDRQNNTPGQTQLDKKVRATPQIEAAIESKKYDSLKVEDRNNLRAYYVERKVDGKQIEFSLAEVAAINNDKKLMTQLDQSELSQEYLADKAHEAKSAAEQIQYETEVIQKVPESRDTKLQRAENTKQQTMVGRQALQHATHHIDHQDKADHQRIKETQREQTPKEIKQIEPDEFTKLKNEYNHKIDSLQKEIKGQPEHESMSRKLSYYKTYPHLSDQEIETYMSIEDNINAQQKDRSISKGKSQELGI